ncbi:hypothetical protein AAC387_Pa05g3291 [Persea americana]
MTAKESRRDFNKFKTGEGIILICTNVAGRGLDIPSVDMVINYDISSNSKVRDGNSGIAISLVNQYEVEWSEQIEKHVGKKLPLFLCQLKEFFKWCLFCPCHQLD